ncbi:LOW QUALITY PROTEIN: hypothetical protein TorRG33x02_039360 [Trema orientale]|uniref:Uncharacterized protein n=1 Tax=Trema orientale TaxID=63057 RepID=A0A2P5FQT6_TREOI|nr:LOW QUALITY PROTEIN: hypothetical protein TorRG33x02_039360 [Trema orientale]
MQFIETHPNELAALSKPMDFDLIVKILDCLDDSYKSILDVLNDRNTPVSFDKLHEKLINKALSLCLQQSISSPLPASTNATNSQPNSRCFGTSALPPQWMPNLPPFTRWCSHLGCLPCCTPMWSNPVSTLLGHCQLCHI